MTGGDYPVNETYSHKCRRKEQEGISKVRLGPNTLPWGEGRIEGMKTKPALKYPFLTCLTPTPPLDI